MRAKWKKRTFSGWERSKYRSLSSFLPFLSPLLFFKFHCALMIILKYFYFVIFIHIDIDKSHFDDVIQFMFSSSIPLPFCYILRVLQNIPSSQVRTRKMFSPQPSFNGIKWNSFLFFVTVTVFMKICLVDELKFYKFWVDVIFK